MVTYEENEKTGRTKIVKTAYNAKYRAFMQGDWNWSASIETAQLKALFASHGEEYGIYLIERDIVFHASVSGVDTLHVISKAYPTM